MNRLKLVVVFVVALAAFVTGGWLLRRGMTRAPEPGAAAKPIGGDQLFGAVLQTVRGYAVDSLDDAAIYRLATSGVLGELGDPYAALVSDRDTAGATHRIGNPPVQGLYLDWADGFVTVVSVAPGSPAATAGFRAGDVVLRVGEVVVATHRPDQVGRMLEGDAGSTVRVRLGREEAPAPLWVTLTRGEVPEPAAAETRNAGGGLTSFLAHRIDSATAARFRQVAESVAAGGGAGLILDLRGVVEGDLGAAVSMAEVLLDSGQMVVVAKGRIAGDSTAFFGRRKAAGGELPVAVLVDRGTAGPAEVVAAALQDHDRAALIGETTFGRGSRQSFFPLGNGQSLRLTTAVWVAPSGRVIQRFNPPPAAEGTTTDTLPERPRFKTLGGRVVFGGGGVVPDREVPATDEPSRVADATLAEARALLGRFRNRQALIAALASN